MGTGSYSFNVESLKHSYECSATALFCVKKTFSRSNKLCLSFSTSYELYIIVKTRISALFELVLNFLVWAMTEVTSLVARHHWCNSKIEMPCGCCSQQLLCWLLRFHISSIVYHTKTMTRYSSKVHWFNKIITKWLSHQPQRPLEGKRSIWANENKFYK